MVPTKTYPMDNHPAMDFLKFEFLEKLAKAGKAIPVSLQLHQYYHEENKLRAEFARKRGTDERPLNPNILLIPVFHSALQKTNAYKTKVRKVPDANYDDKYVCPLSSEMRRSPGEDSFVQGGMTGFKRNWDIFTEGVLDAINWYPFLPFNV
jgi:hypothetical protein